MLHKLGSEHKTNRDAPNCRLGKFRILEKIFVNKGKITVQVAGPKKYLLLHGKENQRTAIILRD